MIKGQVEQPTWTVQVRRIISVDVTVAAQTPEDAVAQVNRRDFRLPPRDQWDGHKDWEYVVYDRDGGELFNSSEGPG